MLRFFNGVKTTNFTIERKAANSGFNEILEAPIQVSFEGKQFLFEYWVADGKKIFDRKLSIGVDDDGKTDTVAIYREANSVIVLPTEWVPITINLTALKGLKVELVFSARKIHGLREGSVWLFNNFKKYDITITTKSIKVIVPASGLLKLPSNTLGIYVWSLSEINEYKNLQNKNISATYIINYKVLYENSKILSESLIVTVSPLTVKCTVIHNPQTATILINLYYKYVPSRQENTALANGHKVAVVLWPLDLWAPADCGVAIFNISYNVLWEKIWTSPAEIVAIPYFYKRYPIYPVPFSEQYIIEYRRAFLYIYKDYLKAVDDKGDSIPYPVALLKFDNGETGFLNGNINGLIKMVRKKWIRRVTLVPPLTGANAEIPNCRKAIVWNPFPWAMLNRGCLWRKP